MNTNEKVAYLILKRGLKNTYTTEDIATVALDAYNLGRSDLADEIKPMLNKLETINNGSRNILKRMW